MRFCLVLLFGVVSQGENMQLSLFNGILVNLPKVERPPDPEVPANETKVCNFRLDTIREIQPETPADFESLYNRNQTFSCKLDQYCCGIECCNDHTTLWLSLFLLACFVILAAFIGCLWQCRRLPFYRRKHHDFIMAQNNEVTTASPTSVALA